MTFKQQWPERAFTIRDGVADPRIIIIKGRNRWALENLMRAGSKGCTPIDHSGWGWSAYVFNLKKVGISIETITELHGGPFARHHARYVLRPGWEDWTMTALRIAFLCRHYGIHADRAAMLAALIWGAGHE